ncbi:MAG: hypothetical protein K0M58_00620 [Thiobacillus sp.]|nr:hypothetical protein [Thiobacillus sp.]
MPSTIRIVVSSTWRHQFTLDQLRARFSPDIAVRIIGVTPGVTQKRNLPKLSCKFGVKAARRGKVLYVTY